MTSNYIETQFQNLEIVHQLTMAQYELNIGEYQKAKYHFSNIGLFKLTDLKHEIEFLYKLMKEDNFDKTLELIGQTIDDINKIIFDFKCDKGWNSLFLTNDENMRFCQDCRKNVYKIENELDLRKHLEANDCIYFLGEVDTPMSCQITTLDSPLDSKKKFSGPMGMPLNIFK